MSAPLLVACATEREMSAALSWAAPVRIPAQGASCHAEIAGRTCLLLTTGVGPVSTAYHVGHAVHQVPLSGILCLGVAGAFAPETLPIGTVAAVTEERFADYGLATENGIDPRGIRLPQGVTRDGEIFDCLPLAPEAAAFALGLSLPGSWPRRTCLTVCAASGDAVVAAERAATGSDMEAMEGFALAYAAAHQDLPFLEVRAISNRVGARPPEDWDLPGALKALGTAAQALFGQV